MIAAAERPESREQASRRMIIVGIDDSAEAGAAAIGRCEKPSCGAMTCC